MLGTVLLVILFLLLLGGLVPLGGPVAPGTAPVVYHGYGYGWGGGGVLGAVLVIVLLLVLLGHL